MFLSLWPRTRASKWARRSLMTASSLCLATARLLAASRAPGAMWPRRERRHEDWAVMMETDSLRRSWWRRRPRSESETGRPSIWEMWAALEAARFFKSEWKSWETSPYCPATKQMSWPKLSRRCWSGPTCLGLVWQYFLSMCCALSRYNLGSPLALWSTDFCRLLWFYCTPKQISNRVVCLKKRLKVYPFTI